MATSKFVYLGLQSEPLFQKTTTSQPKQATLNKACQPVTVSSFIINIHIRTLFSYVKKNLQNA